MTGPGRGWAGRLAGLAVLACAGAAILAPLALMAFRVPYPFEIEWMEGGMLDHVRRILAGQPLYVAPSADFVPFIYPPGFYYVSAIVAKASGLELPALRLVSAVSSVGVLALIALLTWRETQAWRPAVVAAGVFAATYQAGGSWFDVGRVDMLFLFLLLTGFTLVRLGRRSATFALAGLVLALAFLTKQSASVMALPVMLWLLAVDRRKAVLTIATGALVAMPTTLWLDSIHDGWYRFYAFDMPSSYQLGLGRMVRFWTTDLLPVIPVALLLAGVYFVTPGRWRDKGYYFSVVGGLVCGSWLSRGNDGGYYNVLIPAYAGFATTAALGLHAVTRESGRQWAAGRGPVLAAAAVVLQFALLAYNPLAHLPRRESLAAGNDLVSTLRQADGPVWVPYHSYLAQSAGKPGHAHWMAVADILRYGDDDLRDGLARELEAAIAQRRFAVVVLSSNPFPNFPSIDGTYVLHRDLFDEASEGVFRPLTGAPRRPEAVYIPRDAQQLASGALENVSRPSTPTPGRTPQHAP